MKRSILTYLGFDPAAIPDDDENIKFEFANLPQGWEVWATLLVVGAVLYGVVFLYLRELKTCPRRTAVFLAVIRSLVFLTLLFGIYFDPVVAFLERRVEQPYVLVVLDNSSSFGRPDFYLDEASIEPVVAATGRTKEAIREQRPTRAELFRELFSRDDGRFFRDLQKKGKVRIEWVWAEDESATLADEPAAVAPASGTEDTAAADGEGQNGDTGEPPAEPKFEVPQIHPSGKVTYLAEAIRRALNSVAGRPVAGVILISDGQDTSHGDDPVEEAAVARDKRGVSIYTVGIGDSSEARNLRVADLVAEELVQEGDPFEITARIEATNLEGLRVDVHLLEKALAEAADWVDVTSEVTDGRGAQIVLPANGGQETVVFQRTQKKVGPYAYRAVVKPVEHEADEDDNAQQVQVHVRGETSRVLLIAGGPSWEYRIVQGMFRRDNRFELSCWLQSIDTDVPQEGNTPIVKLPRDKKELDEYDVIMMFDPDPLEFNSDWVEALSKYVGEGGGLLFMAGPQFSAKFLIDSRTRDMRKLLPVKLGDVGMWEARHFRTRYSREAPMNVVMANRDEPILRFTGDADFNLRRWRMMPGVYWSFPAVGPSPTGRVLLEHGGGGVEIRSSDGARPLLATGQYGLGRTVYMGFNGTWRWRRVGHHAEYFEKYWVQAVRYLVEGRLSKSKRRGLIETEGGRKFTVGSRIHVVTSKLLDRARNPVSEPKLTAKLQAGRGPATDVKLKPIHDREGEYEGYLRATHRGPNQLSLELEGDKPDEPLVLTDDFNVVLPAIESRDPRLNRKMLKDIAQASGGRYFEVSQLDEIEPALPDKEEKMTRRSKPISLWDDQHNWGARYLLGLIGLLLTVEWALRKINKLM